MPVPEPSPLLSYGIITIPSPLQTSSSGSLRVIGSNSSREDKVVVKSLKIVLSCGENQFNLTNTAGSIVVNAPAGWTVNQEPTGTFVCAMTAPAVVDVLEIVLTNVVVNALPGATVVKIYETARLAEEPVFRPEQKFEQVVWKESQQLWIHDFNIAPTTIRSGESTLVTWDASPSATLTLRFDKDGTGSKDVDVTTSGGSYSIGSITKLEIMPIALKASMSGTSISRSGEVYVRPPAPRFVEFRAERRDGALFLTWRTEFARDCKVTGHPGFVGAHERDFRVDAAVFVRVTAYSPSGDTVSRDVFDVVAKGELRSAKPLPQQWTPRIGAALEADAVYFNRSDGERQKYIVGASADFPNWQFEVDADYMSFSRDALWLALISGRELTVNTTRGAYQKKTVSLNSPSRADFAPFDWALIASESSIGYYDVPKFDYKGGRKEPGPVLCISRDRVYFNAPPDGVSCAYLNYAGSVVVRFGSRVAAVAVDGRENVYVALPDANEVAVFDGKSPQKGIRSRIKVGRTPTGLTAMANQVLVANSGDAFLSVIDPDAEAVVQTIPMPEPMCALIVVQGGSSIFTYTTARDRVLRFVVNMRQRQAPSPNEPALPGIVVDHFVAVPEEVPMWGRAAVAWSVSGPNAASARFALDAPDANRVEATGLHQFIVTQPMTTIVLNITLDVDGETRTMQHSVVVRASM